MMITPEWETDLVARIAELVPASFTATGAEPNIYPHGEGQQNDTRHDGSFAGLEHTTVRFIAMRGELHSDGQNGFADIQVLHRYDPNASADARVVALARMRDVHDRLHAQGAWDGASGQAYIDVRSASAPSVLERGYVVMTLTMWAEQPETP